MYYSDPNTNFDGEIMVFGAMSGREIQTAEMFEVGYDDVIGNMNFYTTSKPKSCFKGLCSYSFAPFIF